MKNANLNETKSRRRSSRGSTNAEEDAIPSSKVAKIDDLKNMSDEIKCDLKNKNVKVTSSILSNVAFILCKYLLRISQQSAICVQRLNDSY